MKHREPEGIDVSTAADYTDSNGKDRLLFGPGARSLNRGDRDRGEKGLLCSGWLSDCLL